MMLFAISDAVWLGIIGIVYMAVKEYFDRVRAKDVRDHVVRAEKKIEEKSLEQSEKLSNVADNVKVIEEVTHIQNKKLDDVVDNVRVIEKATNSMKDALVLATEKEGLERGARQERERTNKPTNP